MSLFRTRYALDLVGHPVSWIAKNVSYLVNLTNKPIWPIVQARDMPESMEGYVDQMSDDEFTQTLQEALKQPSQGIIVFTLEKALAENRDELIKEIFKKTDEA